MESTNLMNKTEKEQAYSAALSEIKAVLEGESQMVLKMSTINCILKTHLPYYFWVGFYCMHEGALIVGPYQGTLGCLHIGLDRGICGRAARLAQTQLIQDVHADPEHLACDSRTNSEIVLPVFDPQGQLIAVFDVDSTEKAAFDELDQQFLEQLLAEQFAQTSLEKQFLS